MSDADLDIKTLVLAAFTLDCAHICAATVLYFDHILTLPSEIALVWPRATSKSSGLFFMNRYVSFFGNMVVVGLSFARLSTEGCKRSLMFHQILLLVTQLIVCWILTLRVYALYTCDRQILWSMFGIALLLVAVSIWGLIGQHNTSVDSLASLPGCHLAVSHGTAIHVAIPWEALLVYDSIIFGATFYKTYQHRGQDLPGAVSLFHLLLRDGSIYYGVIIMSNLSNIATFYISTPILRGSLATFSSSISVIMVSRLTLNLHESAKPMIIENVGQTNELELAHAHQAVVQHLTD
ncbi:hypothetical protein C8J56DRAFT_951775 [Mycena floridula]|nr:hypothetical protein C8J56DRAFT_951775 [Mycena floridula]